MFPVVIFLYNRPKESKDLLCCLLNSNSICNRKVYLFQDGLKQNHNAETWNEVNRMILNWDYPNKIIDVSQSNYGLAQSVFNGLRKVFETSKGAIILEDDLLVSNDFFEYMDQSLKIFVNNKEIGSISGFVHDDILNTSAQTFLFPRPSSWGWATWSDRWNNFKLNHVNLEDINNRKLMSQFARGGEDLPWMLRRQKLGIINSWAVQFSFYQFINELYTIYPSKSKVVNQGFGSDATHTKSNVVKQIGSLNEGVPEFDLSIKPNTKQIKYYSKNYRLGPISRFRNFLSLFFGKNF